MFGPLTCISPQAERERKSARGREEENREAWSVKYSGTSAWDEEGRHSKGSGRERAGQRAWGGYR